MYQTPVIHCVIASENQIYSECTNLVWNNTGGSLQLNCLYLEVYINLLS